MKCRFRGAGGVGGGRSAPQQHTRSKGEQLVLACLLALLACFLVWFRLCNENNRKSKYKKRKENSCQKKKKERKIDR